MNRRSFLKSIGKVIVSCAVVPSVAKAVSKEEQPNPFSPLKSADEFDALMKRVCIRHKELEDLEREYNHCRDEVAEMFRPNLENFEAQLSAGNRYYYIRDKNGKILCEPIPEKEIWIDVIS